ncbi:MAG: MBL fold metallo-hydrolase [Thermoplasmata archaeon]
MIISVLNDNIPHEGYRNGWGLSLFIESGGLKILFDTGPDGEILKYNAEKMGIDIDSVDFIFISHNHWDHTGGLGAIKNRNVRVYVPQISEEMEKAGFRQIKLDTWHNITDDIISTGSIENPKIPEQSLVIRESSRIFLFVGCSHPGIWKIVKNVYARYGKLFFIMGGFHSPPLSDIRDLMEYTEYIGPCHCSGDETKGFFKNNYPERYIEIMTGKVLKF